MVSFPMAIDDIFNAVNDWNQAGRREKKGNHRLANPGLRLLSQVMTGAVMLVVILSIIRV